MTTASTSVVLDQVLPGAVRSWGCRTRARPATADSRRWLQTPTIRTPGMARKPGMCRDRAICPAPTMPIRNSPELIGRIVLSLAPDLARPGGTVGRLIGSDRTAAAESPCIKPQTGGRVQGDCPGFCRGGDPTRRRHHRPAWGLGITPEPHAPKPRRRPAERPSETGRAAGALQLGTAAVDGGEQGNAPAVSRNRSGGRRCCPTAKRPARGHGGASALGRGTPGGQDHQQGR